MDNIIYNRIEALCKDNNISAWKLQQELGFSGATIGTWKRGVMPSSDKIVQIAKYFSVSTDYILGVTDIPETVNDFTDDDIVTIQRLRQNLSSKNRDKMMQLLKIQFSEDFPKGGDD